MDYLSLAIGIIIMIIFGQIAEVNDDYSKNGNPAFWVGVAGMWLGAILIVYNITILLF